MIPFYYLNSEDWSMTFAIAGEITVLYFEYLDDDDVPFRHSEYYYGVNLEDCNFFVGYEDRFLF